MTGGKNTKNYIKELLRFSLFLSLAIFLSSALFSPVINKNIGKEVIPVAAENTPRPRVILDAGHGGVDSGAVSVSGAEEKNLNLAVVKKMAVFLESAGVEVIYTRQTDEMLTSERGATRKTKDLLGRTEVANKYPDAVFVSIHMNTLPVEKYAGLQVFYTDKNDANRPLAQVMQNTVVSLLQPENNRKAKNADGKIYILDRIKQPALLIECGFLSNKNEDILLQSEDYQDRLAFAISRPILDFILAE